MSSRTSDTPVSVRATIELVKQSGWARARVTHDNPDNPAIVVGNTIAVNARGRHVPEDGWSIGDKIRARVVPNTRGRGDEGWFATSAAPFLTRVARSPWEPWQVKNKNPLVLPDTQPGSPHTTGDSGADLDLKCFVCRRATVYSAQIHAVKHGQIWTNTIDIDGCTIDDKISYNKFKKAQVQSVRCVGCGAIIGTYYKERYIDSDTGELKVGGIFPCFKLSTYDSMRDEGSRHHLVICAKNEESAKSAIAALVTTAEWEEYGKEEQQICPGRFDAVRFDMFKAHREQKAHMKREQEEFIANNERLRRVQQERDAVDAEQQRLRDVLDLKKKSIELLKEKTEARSEKDRAERVRIEAYQTQLDARKKAAEVTKQQQQLEAKQREVEKQRQLLRQHEQEQREAQRVAEQQTALAQQQAAEAVSEASVAVAAAEREKCLAVARAEQEILKLRQGYEGMIRSWECQTDDGWLLYDRSVSVEIDASYLRGETYSFAARRQRYEIRFNHPTVGDHQQINQFTGIARPVRCSETGPKSTGCPSFQPCHIPPPEHGCKHSIVSIDLSRFRDDPAKDYHFRMAESQLLRMYEGRLPGNGKVTTVEVVVNPELEARFDRRKAALTAERGEANEIFAFHGATEAAYSSIASENFDISKLALGSGDRGWYGAGIYFSEFPSEAKKYANGGKRLLLSRVLVGKAFECRGRMDGHPKQSGYDSHRSDNKLEIVIFDCDQILPTYIVSLG